MVSAGAKLLGSFTVGENSKIGAGSVVLDAVPPNCTVVGVPGVSSTRQTEPCRDRIWIRCICRILSLTICIRCSGKIPELVNRVLSLEAEMKEIRKKEEKQ